MSLNLTPHDHIGDGTNQTLGERCHDALIETGKAKAAAFKAERLYKRKRATVYLHMQGTVAERDASSRKHEEVVAAEDRWIEAEMTHNIKRAESDGLQMRFEEWRTKQSTARAEMQLR